MTPNRREIRKDIFELSGTIHQLLILRTAQSQLFSSSHGNFTNIDHILGSEMHVTKSKLTEITRLLSDGQGIKLEINEKKDGKLSSTHKFNNTF